MIIYCLKLVVESEDNDAGKKRQVKKYCEHLS